MTLKKNLSKGIISISIFLTTLTNSFAACTMTDVANKVWKTTAIEVTEGMALWTCKFSFDGRGKIGSLKKACLDNYIGARSYTDPVPVGANITSGSISLLSSAECTYEILLNLSYWGGPVVVRSRIILDPTKVVAHGSFLVSWGGGGTLSMVRI